MKVSLIIPTYNGCHKLERLLYSLEKQTYRNFETIVVVDGSTDNTLEFLKNRRHTLSSLTVINQENGGRTGARNVGGSKAGGDVFIFLDDDLLLEPDCIWAHVSHHQLHAGSIGGGRPVMIANDNSSLFGKYGAYLSAKWERSLLEIEGLVAVGLC